LKGGVLPKRRKWQIGERNEDSRYSIKMWYWGKNNWKGIGANSMNV